MEIWNLCYGAFLGAWESTWLIAAFIAFTIFAYNGLHAIFWIVLGAILLIGFKFHPGFLTAYALTASGFMLPILRRRLSGRLLKRIAKMQVVPQISDTERAALDAGVVWIEGEFFSGSPNFRRITKFPKPQLSVQEQAFLAGPTEELCAIIDEWKAWKQRQISEEVLDFIKQEKFLGMIIPKQFGGMGFSARAQGEVVAKIASRSVAATVLVMVPNSLGPAELLVHYGTEQQKELLLPRLANGTEIPCFALTETVAGSDAGALESTGVLFKNEAGVLMLRLNWEKRWISLAGIATLIGIAFRLFDPDDLLGTGKDDLGITCGLVPASLPGVDLSKRHDPLGIPFNNSPTRGVDVVIEAEQCIIGGTRRAGQGWTMLMESLAAGRGISLPAQSGGAGKFVLATVGAHAAIRRQFGNKICAFEGVKEVLGEIAADVYAIDAMRSLTFTALDSGTKAPIVTAITKYFTTELGRTVVNKGMDILGGSGISMGPRNLTAFHYLSAPIGITVEGANILTRTLMIYGQGALRAHPYSYSLIKAVEKNDTRAFDTALWGYGGHIVKNTVRCILLYLTRGRSYLSCPRNYRRYYQRLAWTSATFAILTDALSVMYGARLKAKESLTGRCADVLGWMYIATAILKRHQDAGHPIRDKPIVELALDSALLRIQSSFEGICNNIDRRGMKWLFRIVVKGALRLNPIASSVADSLKYQAADLVTKPGEVRDRMIDGIFRSDDPKDLLGRYEHALSLDSAAADVEKKIRQAIKDKLIAKDGLKKLIGAATSKGAISDEEARRLGLAQEACMQALAVDEFTAAEYGLSSEQANKLQSV